MLGTLNKVLLIGFVGRDPELRYTPAGKPVATFSLAVPRTWETPEGATHTATEWFAVVAWRNLAEASHADLRKDRRVFVEGSLQTRSWTDPDGRRQQCVEVLATDIVPLDAVAPATAPAGEVPEPTQPLPVREE